MIYVYLLTSLSVISCHHLTDLLQPVTCCGASVSAAFVCKRTLIQISALINKLYRHDEWTSNYGNNIC